MPQSTEWVCQGRVNEGYQKNTVLNLPKVSAASSFYGLEYTVANIEQL